MSKELTPLEALENIETYLYVKLNKDIKYHDVKEYIRQTFHFDIIENELKEKEAIDNHLVKHYLVNEEWFNKNKKQKEILRIIKTMPFELEYDEDTDDWHLYIIIITQDGKYRETVAFGEGKDKYDLLKEVLL